MIALAIARAAAAAAAPTMGVVCVGVAHAAAPESNLRMSRPAERGTESPVCARSRKKERAGGYGQPDGGNAGATNESPAVSTELAYTLTMCLITTDPGALLASLLCVIKITDDEEPYMPLVHIGRRRGERPPPPYAYQPYHQYLLIVC